MTVCAAGHREIVGGVWTVDDWDTGEPSPMCQTHAQIIGLGRALADRHGLDHPWVLELIPSFTRMSKAACPDVVSVEPDELDDDTRAALERFAPWSAAKDPIT